MNERWMTAAFDVSELSDPEAEGLAGEVIVQSEVSSLHPSVPEPFVWTPGDAGDTDTTIYFAVPDHYTIGDEYPTFQHAVYAARQKIRPFDFGGYSRAFVDVRLKDPSGDRSLHRIEIFHDDRQETPA